MKGLHCFIKLTNQRLSSYPSKIYNPIPLVYNVYMLNKECGNGLTGTLCHNRIMKICS